MTGCSGRNCNVIWRRSGVTEKYVMVVQDIFEETVCCCFDWVVPGEGGVHQGPALGPFFFPMMMDRLTKLERNPHGLWCLQTTLWSAEEQGRGGWEAKEVKVCVCPGKKRNDGWRRVKEKRREVKSENIKSMRNLIKMGKYKKRNIQGAFGF